MQNTLLSIYHISKRAAGYGHWKIALDCDLPTEELITDEGTIYSAPTGTLTTITTNSRAIDGYNGADRALAAECLRNNNLDDDDYDLSTLADSD